jgi:hypothetical protein
MRTHPFIPGVPAAGHVTGGGAWHPGRAEGCPKCPAPTMVVWRAPSGRHHLRPTCSGGAARSRMTRVTVTERQFADLDRCRCLHHFRST